jgi:hypothetical protein
MALAVAFCCLLFLPPARAQAVDNSIVSKHVRIRIPVDRQWLAREVINDMERCWDFVRRATGGRLPGPVLIIVDWNRDAASGDAERGVVTIGMNLPAAAADMKNFLLHGTARELARMALMDLSGGGAAREENRFLLEGMSEMLAHEFESTVRGLQAAWAISFYLDRIGPLALKQLPSRPELAANSHDFRAAAPGITFLTACRELYGRERVLKLFQSLARKDLEESIAAAFKTTLAVAETEWLTRVRKYSPDDVTIAGEEEAPVMARVAFTPDPGKAGTTVAMQLFARDGTSDLTAAGIFVLDEASGKVLQGNQVRGKEGDHIRFGIPIEPARAPGRYQVRVIAMDEAGNVRNWEAFFSVVR